MATGLLCEDLRPRKGPQFIPIHTPLPDLGVPVPAFPINALLDVLLLALHCSSRCLNQGFSWISQSYVALGPSALDEILCGRFPAAFLQANKLHLQSAGSISWAACSRSIGAAGAQPPPGSCHGTALAAEDVRCN